MGVLPDIPDAPVSHRLRTLTFLATAATLLLSLTSTYKEGPVGSREYVFSGVANALRSTLGFAPVDSDAPRKMQEQRKGEAPAGVQRVS